MNTLSGFSLLQRDFHAILSNRPTGSQEQKDRVISGNGFQDIGRWEIEIGEATIRVKDIAVLASSLLSVQNTLRQEGIEKGEKPSHEYHLIDDMLETLYGLAQVSMRKVVIDLHDTVLPTFPGVGRFAVRKGWKVVYAPGLVDRSEAFAGIPAPLAVPVG